MLRRFMIRKPLTRRFTFFCVCLGMMFFPSFGGITIVALPVILAIIWAGSGFRYVMYGFGLALGLNLPNIVVLAMRVSGMTSELVTGILWWIRPRIYSEIASKCSHLSPHSCHVMVERVDAVFDQVMTLPVLELITSNFGVAILASVGAFSVFLPMAFLLKKKWARRLARIRSAMKGTRL